jgi:hypothetical protein
MSAFEPQKQDELACRRSGARNSRQTETLSPCRTESAVNHSSVFVGPTSAMNYEPKLPHFLRLSPVMSKIRS